MLIVAIDGPSGAGKGTIAKYLENTFKWPHIDSGLLYRHAGLYLLNHHLDGQIESLDPTHIEKLCHFISDLSLSDLTHNLEALRLEETANAASKVAINPLLRTTVNEWIYKQRDILAQSHEGLIVDGRDITSVVFPHADVKLFITADAETRQKRRFKDTKESTATITSSMTHRDVRDSTRTTAPLMASKDAFLIDTTHLSVDEACRNAAEYVTICRLRTQ